MLANLSIGLSTMVVCLALQALLIVVAAHYYARSDRLIRSTTFGTSFVVVTTIMLLLVVGNLLQAAIWALLFRALGEFGEFSAAFYHSVVNFSTLGYGDIVMSSEHRLLGPLEAINGALMIGVTSAALITAFEHVKEKADESRGGPLARR